MGTTNIDPGLLAEIQTMTTYAPQDGGWPDTSAKDLGYHYSMNEDSTYTGVPDSWIWHYFGNYNENGTNVDGQGNALSYDYQYGIDPNIINFNVVLSSQHFNVTNPIGSYSIFGGVPSYEAVLVNDTNLNDAVWSNYDENAYLSLGPTDGVYQVWLGLKGTAPNATPTWIATLVYLDRVPPQINVTNPVSGTVMTPYVQLSGFASKELQGVTYSISNALGVTVSQRGVLAGSYFDPSSLDLSTIYFQSDDILLTNGMNTVFVSCTDLAGNVATTNVNLTLGYSSAPTPPPPTVIWPVNNTPVGNTNCALQAQVGDPTAALTLSVVDAAGHTNLFNGITTGNGLALINNVQLGTGLNTMTLTVTSAAGTSSATSFAVSGNDLGLTMDEVPPDQLTNSTVTLTGLFNGGNDTLTVNGMAATITNGTIWTVTVPVPDGNPANFQVQVYDSNNTELGEQVFYQWHPATVTATAYTDVERNWYLQDGTGQCLGPQLVGFDQILHWDDALGGYKHQTNVTWDSICGDPAWTNVSVATYPTNFTYFSNPHLLAYPYYVWEYGKIEGWMPPVGESYNVRTKVKINPSGQGADGTMRSYLVRASAIELEWGLDWGQYNAPPFEALPPEWLQINGQTLVDSGVTNNFSVISEQNIATFGETILQGPAGEQVDATPVATRMHGDNYFAQGIFQGNQQTEVTGIYPITDYLFDDQTIEIPAPVPDLNRDGVLAFDGSDDTGPNKPFRFWVDDSQEQGDISTPDNDIPGSPSPNYALNQVNGRRDLVNFFPVALNLQNILQLLPLTNGYEYHLSQADSAVKFVYTSLAQYSAFDYLTNATATGGYGVNGDEPPQSADTLQILPSGTTGTKLDTNWLTSVQANGGIGIILIEGAAATQQPLNLEIWHKDKHNNLQKLGGLPMFLSISSVEQMYRQVNLRSGGSTADPGQPPNYPDSLCNGKQVMFIHGFSVTGADARGWNAEIFKRLYQAHSHAMFTGVTWEGDDHVWFDSTGHGDYYGNVMNAFLTASNFNVAAGNLPGAQKYVMAHSLGNMVVCSAIKDFGLSVNGLFALDAAIATEAFDGNNNIMNMVNPDAFNTFEGWLNYDQRLWASSWHNLFPNSDARSGLNWVNRFGVINNFYNFYSSGENTLRNTDGHYPDPLSVYSSGEWPWVCQEMSKGGLASSLLSPSSQSGWQLNTYWYIPSDPAHPGSNLRPRYPWEANLADYTDRTYINTNDLVANPFFAPFNDSLVMDVSAGGSEAANLNVSADIMGGGIPALSNPTGANSVAVFGERNFDMMNMEATDGGGNFIWPASRPLDSNQHPRWFHSDFEEVAYPFNYSLYSIIVNYINN